MKNDHSSEAADVYDYKKLEYITFTGDVHEDTWSTRLPTYTQSFNIDARYFAISSADKTFRSTLSGFIGIQPPAANADEDEKNRNFLHMLK